MANIIARDKHTVLMETLGDPIQAQRVFHSFMRIVSDSLVEDLGARRISEATQAETKRRTNIIYDWFILLRKECGYSTTHALDVLPQALRARLDGVDWTPAPAERMWVGGN